jgi:replication fork clamp-binding protein CrfC
MKLYELHHKTRIIIRVIKESAAHFLKQVSLNQLTNPFSQEILFTFMKMSEQPCRPPIYRQLAKCLDTHFITHQSNDLQLTPN